MGQACPPHAAAEPASEATQHDRRPSGNRRSCHAGVRRGVLNFLLLALTGPVPTALVALTVQVYFLPGVRPLTLIGLAGPVLVFVFAPFLPEQVTAYDVTGLPPSDARVKVTLAFFGDIALAEMITGAPGAVVRHRHRHQHVVAERTEGAGGRSALVADTWQ